MSARCLRRTRNRASGLTSGGVCRICPCRRHVRFADPARRDFELRDLTTWVERAVCELIGAFLVGPMIRNEDRVRPDGIDDHRAQGDLIAPRGDRHPIVIHDAILRRQPWMDFNERFGIDVHQPSDAARLRPGKILTDDPARRKVNRKLLVYGISALTPLRNIEPAPAIGKE